MTAPRPAAKVAKALVTKGMTPDENHHHMYRKTIDGVTTMVTRISHGSPAIGDSLGKLMANQCVLRLAEFWDLVDCTLSEAEWEKRARERCVDGRNPYLGH